MGLVLRKKPRFFQQVAHRRAERSEALVQNGMLCDEDKLSVLRHKRDERRDRFPHSALRAVADHSIAELFTDGKTDFESAGSAGNVNEHHAPCMGRFAYAVGMAKLLVTLE